MKLKYHDEIFDVELTGSTIKLNKELIQFDTTKLSDNHFLLKSFQNHNAFVSKSQTAVYVSVEGEHYEFKIIDEEEEYLSSANNANQKIEKIFAPMPGAVVKLLVAEGDIVEAKQAIIVVEAMKMETTLLSGIAGRITSINATIGQQVSTDSPIIVIEKVD